MGCLIWSRLPGRWMKTHLLMVCKVPLPENPFKKELLSWVTKEKRGVVKRSVDFVRKEIYLWNWKEAFISFHSRIFLDGFSTSRENVTSLIWSRGNLKTLHPYNPISSISIKFPIVYHFPTKVSSNYLLTQCGKSYHESFSIVCMSMSRFPWRLKVFLPSGTHNSPSSNFKALTKLFLLFCRARSFLHKTCRCHVIIRANTKPWWRVSDYTTKWIRFHYCGRKQSFVFRWSQVA